MNHLEQIITGLADEQVNFIICGGVALVLQGVERSTIDLDLSVSFEPQNLQRFIKVMKQLELAPRSPVGYDFILNKDNVDQIVKEKNALVFTFVHGKHHERQVDVFLTEDLSYDTLIPKSDSLDIYNHKIKVLSRKGLLEAKQKIDPARDKDLFDIKQLLKLVERDEDNKH